MRGREDLRRGARFVGKSDSSGAAKFAPRNRERGGFGLAVVSCGASEVDRASESASAVWPSVYERRVVGWRDFKCDARRASRRAVIVECDRRKDVRADCGIIPSRDERSAVVFSDFYSAIVVFDFRDCAVAIGGDCRQVHGRSFHHTAAIRRRGERDGRRGVDPNLRDCRIRVSNRQSVIERARREQVVAGHLREPHRGVWRGRIVAHFHAVNVKLHTHHGAIDIRRSRRERDPVAEVKNRAVAR